LRRSILACGLLLACAGISTAAAAAAGSSGTPTPATTLGSTRVRLQHTQQQAMKRWKRRLRHERATARRWLTVIHGRPPRLPSRSIASVSLERLRVLARKWHRRQHAAWRRAQHPPDLQGWLCIHRYEGSWKDSGAPYWGGLQMDLSFQESYGRWLLEHKGTANHWSILEQIWVAVRAWRLRGFSPWANTARFCGLLE
jgi:hypothetical protein